MSVVTTDIRNRPKQKASVWHWQNVQSTRGSYLLFWGFFKQLCCLFHVIIFTFSIQHTKFSLCLQSNCNISIHHYRIYILSAQSNLQKLLINNTDWIKSEASNFLIRDDKQCSTENKVSLLSSQNRQPAQEALKLAWHCFQISGEESQPDCNNS